jgi:glyoxalase family protein
VRTSLRVAGRDALEWWKGSLADKQVAVGDIVERDGRAQLDLEDIEGQRLTLVDDGGQGTAYPWEKSPVPAAHQIRGLGPVILSVSDLRGTDVILEKVLNMRPVRQYPHPDNPRHSVHVYEMADGGAHAELHVAVQPDLAAAQSGAGGVHHVAFRTPDADYDAWAERLNAMHVPNSGEVDRFWFQSLYFREPNGILFEIATEGPGFAVDESEDTLGERVVLAPFLESKRAEIVANLKPID